MGNGGETNTQKGFSFLEGVEKTMRGSRVLSKGCKLSTQGGLMFVEGGCSVELNKGI